MRRNQHPALDAQECVCIPVAYQVLAAVLGHHVDKIEGPYNVVLVISKRELNAFTHGFEAGEVDARSKPSAFEHSFTCGSVGQVNLLEVQPIPLVMRASKNTAASNGCARQTMETHRGGLSLGPCGRLGPALA
eukprot:scaffold2627_cov421-Prasinococcus_capsulatus_cf.AAC.3